MGSRFEEYWPALRKSYTGIVEEKLPNGRYRCFYPSDNSFEDLTAQHLAKLLNATPAPATPNPPPKPPRKTKRPAATTKLDKPAKKPKNASTATKQPAAEKREEFVPAQILEEKLIDGQPHYLVRWEG